MRSSINLILITVLVLCSCSDQQKEPVKIVEKEKELPEIKLTDQILIGEWRRDSISGQNNIDWVVAFFGDDHKFYSFNLTQTTLPFDEYHWEIDKIINGKDTFILKAIDSCRIRIEFGNNQHFYSRLDDLDSTRIPILKRNKEMASELIGEWEMYDADFYPISLPNCETYFIRGSHFIFDTTSNLIAKDANAQKNPEPEYFRYHFSYLEDSLILVERGCMVSDYKIKKLMPGHIMLTGNLSPARLMVLRKLDK